ncbi:MAG: bacillithiol system redox-active protein YtxJ [Bacteroidetes bacterium]|nr:bacillithiol system redox-active protein YtxJ [Bacteroidota bacterium]
MGIFDRIFSGETPVSSSLSTAKVGAPVWTALERSAQIQEILERSKARPCLIFKHSTRCSISAMALNRLETGWNVPAEALDCWFLDLIAYRELSQTVAQTLRVQHESPQVLLVRNGAVFYRSSHSAINPTAIREALAQA